ncbi:MAG: hypothetical protein IAF58_01545 [Leptolyngbya sp.]|nr:hypothetical protein [Candidatus Melainabacteria bacterium]
MKKLLSKSAGFSVAELLIVVAVILIILGVIVGCGWGIAFAFSATVVIPALHIATEWVGLATVVSSLLLTGVGTLIVIVVLFLSFGALGLVRRKR